jgi:hypothetical protein
MLSTLYSVSKNICWVLQYLFFRSRRHFMPTKAGLVQSLPSKLYVRDSGFPSINHLPSLMIESWLSFNILVQAEHSTLFDYKPFQSSVVISGSEFNIRYTTSRFSVRLFQPGLYFRHTDSGEELISPFP